jgi:protein ImuA
MAFPSFAPKVPPPLTRSDVWRGDELATAETRVVSTGHVALDAQLPGGGWPIGALTEVLQAVPEAQVWQLLLPALALAVRRHGGRVVLVGAPQVPFVPAIAAGGLPAETLLWIRGDGAVARSWACEQALRCADVAAVLAWLPQARASDLRRLQLAAAQHENLLFVFRPEAQARMASPARLRLRFVPVSVPAQERQRTRLQSWSTDDDFDHAGAPDAQPRRGGGVAGLAGRAVHAVHADQAGRMEVDVLKRRGPPLATPLALPARGERLAALLRATLRRRRGRQAPAPSDIPHPQHLEGGPLDAVDRIAVAG